MELVWVLVGIAGFTIGWLIPARSFPLKEMKERKDKIEKGLGKRA